MSTFTDQMFLQFLQDTFVEDLVKNNVGLSALFNVTYKLEGFQKLARRSGFNNTELLDLMAAIPADRTEMFMRTVRAMPDSAFGRGVGISGLNFFQDLVERPRSMRFFIDADYETFFALYRYSNSDFARFEENLDAL